MMFTKPLLLATLAVSVRGMYHLTAAGGEIFLTGEIYEKIRIDGLSTSDGLPSEVNGTYHRIPDDQMDRFNTQYKNIQYIAYVPIGYSPILPFFNKDRIQAPITIQVRDVRQRGGACTKKAIVNICNKPHSFIYTAEAQAGRGGMFTSFHWKDLSWANHPDAKTKVAVTGVTVTEAKRRRLIESSIFREPLTPA